MPSAFPAPCRVRRGTTGSDYYYFDGVNPMTTFASSGAGTALNNILGNAGTFDSSTSDFDDLQLYLRARQIAFAQLAACEVCPEAGDLQTMVGDTYEEMAGG